MTNQPETPHPNDSLELQHTTRTPNFLCFSVGVPVLLPSTILSSLILFFSSKIKLLEMKQFLLYFKRSDKRWEIVGLDKDNYFLS